jgi:hypothetical protein
MPFFQNVFDQEFQGYLVLADRKLSPTFVVPPNRNVQSKQVAWNPGPYDLSSGGNLEFNFSWDPEFRSWSSLSIDVTGADPSATSPREVVNALNSDPIFNSMYIASVVPVDSSESVGISKNPQRKQNFKAYFGNSGAETKLGFNKMAGVAEIPEYFSRHTIENRNLYPDSLGILIRLDESDPQDQSIIETAGFDPAGVKADWELMRGRGSGLFTFKKMTVDLSDRITEIIEYPAGALPGDFARKINYSYFGSNKNPSQVTEVPHVLNDSDLVSP